MQSKNPFVDDLAKLMRGAVGVAQGAKEELETIFSSKVDRWLGERNLVSREEFDVLLKRVEDLQKEVKELQSKRRKNPKVIYQKLVVVWFFLCPTHLGILEFAIRWSDELNREPTYYMLCFGFKIYPSCCLHIHKMYYGLI